MGAPLEIGIFDKTFKQVGEIGAPKFVTVNPRDISVGFGTATVSVLANARYFDKLQLNNRLCINRDDGSHLMSGPIVTLRGGGTTRRAVFEFDIVDDASVLDEITGWVMPGEDVTDQGITEAVRWTLLSDAETVLKTAVQQNGVDRLGMPIEIAPNLHRGSTVRGDLRYEPLWTKLFPVVDGCGLSKAGIGVTVRQNGEEGLLLDVYERSTYPHPLTEIGGNVLDWSVTQSAPTATRVIVGGPGEGYLRSLRTVEDTAREAEIGRIIERWRDARDVDVSGVPTVLYARGQEVLDEGAAKSGLSLKLAERGSFRYGQNVRVGDTVTINVAGITVTDVLVEALLSWTDGEGWRIEPRVGDKSDDPDRRLAQVIQKLARAVNRMQRT